MVRTVRTAFPYQADPRNSSELMGFPIHHLDDNGRVDGGLEGADLLRPCGLREEYCSFLFFLPYFS